ncbi:putative transferase [Helianthus annuus]|nr:putative transferase [Helianthus annuus]
MRIFFCILVLHVASIIYAQDDQSGFISLDCGSPKGSNYTQDGINYISDDGFIEAGETYVLATQNPSHVYNTLRSFPENKRNCYTLRPQKGKNNRYLIRATFLHGNYDSRNQNPQFDLYIGADHWVTIVISDPAKSVTHEIIHLTLSDYIYVCLVYTGYGYPFITSLELRLLDITMYKDQSPASLLLFLRYNYGAYDTVRSEFLIFL